MRKRCLALLLALLLALAQSTAASAEGGVPLAGISKYGNLVLEITGEAFFASGYDYGDVISAEILGAAWRMPVGSSYSDVDEGKPVCRVESMEDAVVLAVNMGDLATSAGIAVKESLDEKPGYRWVFPEGVELPLQISISMEETGAYRDEWLIRRLARTDERADYSHLDDAAFANFRMVDTPGMAAGVLYRSSSPINPELGRSAYAVAAMEEAGIRTVINLTDAAPDYPDWEGSYYAGCDVCFLNMNLDPMSEDFRTRFAEGLRFMLAHEGPYLVHCKEGKDRAGFVSAVLECLMGADAQAVVDDYMETYYNYYGVQAGTGQYEAIVNSNIASLLPQVFEAEDLFACDLAAEASEYLEGLGLSAEELDKLKAKLAG